MTEFKVGDKLKLCALIDDFCGISDQGLTFKQQSISLAPSDCGLPPSYRNCKQISNIEIWFRFAKISGSAECNSCSPVKNFHDIARTRTNSYGQASTEYTITEQDYTDYQECAREGMPFKFVTCISDDLGQGIIQKGACSDAVVVVPAPLQPGDEPNGVYEIRGKYWESPFYRNSAEVIIKGIADFWNAHVSEYAGWTLKSTTVNTSTKELIITVEKTGSIPIMQLLMSIASVIPFILGFIIYDLVIKYVINPKEVNNYIKGATDMKTDVKIALGCDGSNPLKLSPGDLSKICKAVDDVPIDPSRAKLTPTVINNFTTYLRDAVKTPTLKAPLIALVNEEFEVSGTCDANTEVKIIKDDKFSIWDIFRGDPLAFLNESLGSTTSDANGNYKLKLKLDKQEAYRIYAETGGKQSTRSKVYVLEIVTSLAVISVFASLAYYVYKKKYRRR